MLRSNLLELHGVVGQVYLTDILTRLVNLWLDSWIDELLP
jgi:hypothetical protein